MAQQRKKNSSGFEDSYTKMYKAITKEMGVYESTMKRPELLQKFYKALTTIPPSSIESERSFSSANNLVTKLRTQLGDRTIDMLIFLRSDFLQQEVRQM